MIPYIPPTPLLDPQVFNVNSKNTEFCSSEGLESVVKEGMTPSLEKDVQSPDPKLPQTILEPQGLESVVEKEILPNLVEKDVLSPASVSTDLSPPAVPKPQEPLQVTTKKSKRGKPLQNSKIIGVSRVSFDLIRLNHDPDTYLLVMHDTESSPEVEELPGVRDESRLPKPHLLKGWWKETRLRPGGARDKFYSHATCTRLIRSIVEVVNYIKTNNNLLDANPKNKFEDDELRQGSQGHRNIPEASSSPSPNGRKRKFCNFQEKLKFEEKTREQVRIEEFFATAHQNLMSLSPPTAKAQEAKNGSALQAYFALTNEKIKNFLKGNGNDNGNTGNGNNRNQSREEVEEWINELLNK